MSILKYPAVMDALFADIHRILHWHGCLIPQAGDSAPKTFHVALAGGHANVTYEGRTILWEVWKWQSPLPSVPTGDSGYIAVDAIPSAHDVAQTLAQDIGADFGTCSIGYVQTNHGPGETIPVDVKIRKRRPKVAPKYVIDGIVQETVPA